MGANRCKSCNKQIKWVITHSGKKMPVNVEEIIILPKDEGKYIVVTADGEVVRGDLVMAGTPGAVRGYVSHFATCPHADKWRK